MDTQYDPYELFTRREAAEYLRINVAYLGELTRAQTLHSVKIGRRILVPRASLEAFIRGERPGAGITSADGSSWPATPSLFNGRNDAARRK